MGETLWETFPPLLARYIFSSCRGTPDAASHRPHHCDSHATPSLSPSIFVPGQLLTK